MNDKREIKDRRANNLTQDQTYPYNRRTRPCRRLDSISVKWIAPDNINRLPA